MYLADYTGSQKLRNVTSGKQGVNHNPVFSFQWRYKVTWTELDGDGYESDTSVADHASLPRAMNNFNIQSQRGHLPQETYLLHAHASICS